MGHFISGLIGARDRLASIASHWALNAPAELNQGFGFLPLDKENLPALLKIPDAQIRLDCEADDREDGDAFEYLTPSLIAFCVANSLGNRFAYVETQYFGGLGGQGAAVFDDGKLVWGPIMDSDSKPIGDALQMLGATQTAGEYDLFDSVGLGRHRDNDDWRLYPGLTDKPEWQR